MLFIRANHLTTKSAEFTRLCSVFLLLMFLGVACGRQETPSQAEPAAPSPASRGQEMGAPSGAVQVPAAQKRLRQIAAIPSRAQSPDQALTELRPWLSDEDRDAREAAVLALWDIETDSANQALAEAARKDPDPEVKSYALEELVDREAPQALDTLMGLLSDPDADIREQSAEGLETLDDPRAADTLYAALKTEKDDWVRDAIMSALETLDPDFDEDDFEE